MNLEYNNNNHNNSNTEDLCSPLLYKVDDTHSNNNLMNSQVFDLDEKEMQKREETINSGSLTSLSAGVDDTSSEESGPNPEHAQPNNTNEQSSGPFLYRRTKQLVSYLSASEISGSLGDLGTLIPLLVAMARQRSVLLAPALFFAGVSNVIGGYLWDVPMCVQPMKSIAAVALAEQLTKEEVTCAGILTGIIVFTIGITGFIEIVNKIVPENVVSGIQMGVGIRLASKAFKMIQELGWIGHKAQGDGQYNIDCILLAVFISLFVMICLRSDHKQKENELKKKERTKSHQPGQVQDQDNRYDSMERRATRRNKKWYSCCCTWWSSPNFQHPVGVYLLVIGAIFAAYELITTDNKDGKYDLPLQFFGAPIATWALESVTSNDWKVGFLQGAIPQLPLTTLNSVISVCALANSLYATKGNREDGNNTPPPPVLSRKEVCISVGLINLFFCPFGSMPNCHGAGGLAAQHRFGARHGTSVVFLGICKILLAIFFGKSALTLLDAFPVSILGVMLAIAGLELATTGLTFLVNHSFKDIIQIEPRRNFDDEEQGGNLHGNSNNDVDRRPNSITIIDVNSPIQKKERLRRNAMVAIVTTSVTVSLGKAHIGAFSGWVVHMIFNDGISEPLQKLQFFCRNRHGD